MGIVFLINLLILAAFPQSARAVTIKSITVAAAVKVIDISAIPGVTAPVKGATPVTVITETDQYTGTVSWETTPIPGTIEATMFGPLTAYTATITLIPKTGYTLTGVAANFFTVAGATPVTNSANSGEVTAAFPITAQVRIGESFGGGIVAYINQTDQHGLIAAPADQSSGIPWAKPSFQSTSVPSPGATGTAIGTGKTNTDAIIDQNGSGSDFAAGIARNYTGGGYTDWYLPSKDELGQLYVNLKDNNDNVGGFAADYYWSSSEYSATHAWIQLFGNSVQLIYNKVIDNRVRAVRAF